MEQRITQAQRDAVLDAYEPPIFCGASRQHSRAMARRAFKERTRPGLHKRKHASPKAVIALLAGGPNTPCRRIRYVRPPAAPRAGVKYDAWLHPTKGYRCQLVAA